jgi:hypothetical protein
MSEVKANKISPATSTVVTLGDSSDTFVVATGAKLDINGTELILDADADTSITADTDDQIDIKVGGSDVVTIDSSGNVGIGETPPGGTRLKVLTTVSDNLVATFENSHATGSYGISVKAGDDSGNYAADFANKSGTSLMRVRGDGDINVATGDLIFGTAGKGVCLGVTTNTDSNTLDDYEEGLHVATVRGYGSGNWVMNSSYDTLSYTKVGRLVHVQGLIETASDNSANGQLTISLPFTQLATSEGGSNSKPFMLIYNHGDGGIENAYCSNSPGVSDTYGANVTDAGVAEVIDHSRLDASFAININMCYYAA